MLTMTENAVMVIRDLTAQQGGPQTAGLRICSDQSAGSFTIQAAAEPAPGDQVVENLGARLFLDSDAAQMLDDKALDAGVGDQGDVQFAIMDRPQ